MTQIKKEDKNVSNLVIIDGIVNYGIIQGNVYAVSDSKLLYSFNITE